MKKSNKTEPRVEARKKQGKLSESRLYSIISKKPGLSTYELEKLIKWSGGKVRTTLNRLEKMGVIETEKLVHEGRIKRICRPVGWKKLVKDNNLVPKKQIIIATEKDKICAEDILSNKNLFSADVIKKISGCI